MQYPNRGAGARKQRIRQFRRLLQLPVLGVALTVAAACSSAQHTGTASASGVQKTTAGCGLRPSMMTTMLPGFVTMFRGRNVPLPGSHGISGHPRQDVTQYVCGQSNGFVSRVIMYGKYRALDDSLARSLGYMVGKWPLLPVIGRVVSDLPHNVFEAYEEVFQFRSMTAARDWLQGARWTPASPHNLVGVSLPTGFIARAGVSGPDDGRHEHGIGISGQIGTMVIIVSFNGGRELSWPDVQPLWKSTYERLSASATARSTRKQ